MSVSHSQLNQQREKQLGSNIGRKNKGGGGEGGEGDPASCKPLAFHTELCFHAKLRA